MRRLWLLLWVLLLFPLPSAASVPVIGPSTYTFNASGQSAVWTCNGGQSSFQLTAPSGLTGVLTVTVAQTASGTFANPPWAYAPGAPAYTNTITNSGSLTVNLGSNLYVKVADTTYTSGSVTVTGGCSAAVAVVPPQVTSVGATSPLSSSGGSTPNVSLTGTVSVANGGTGASSLASAPFVALNPASAQSGAINVTGNVSSGSSTYGPTSATVNGIITQPGYAQHGIATLTTPATCSANTACGTVAVTFSPATTSAPECTATAATTPGYVFSSVAPSTSGVTFAFVTLNAISSATAVPVSYDCKV